MNTMGILVFIPITVAQKKHEKSSFIFSINNNAYRRLFLGQNLDCLKRKISMKNGKKGPVCSALSLGAVHKPRGPF